MHDTRPSRRQKYEEESAAWRGGLKAPLPLPRERVHLYNPSPLADLGFLSCLSCTTDPTIVVVEQRERVGKRSSGRRRELTSSVGRISLTRSVTFSVSAVSGSGTAPGKIGRRFRSFRRAAAVAQLDGGQKRASPVAPLPGQVDDDCEYCADAVRA